MPSKAWFLCVRLIGHVQRPLQRVHDWLSRMGARAQLRELNISADELRERIARKRARQP